MNYSCLITLNEKSIENNVRFLQKKLGSKVVLSAVVKANAYGHGIEPMVPLLSKYGVKHFSCFYYSEACRIKQVLSAPSTILIMGYIPGNKLVDAIRSGFEYFVFSMERLHETIQVCKEFQLKAKIHLEMETGMNRSGIDQSKLPELIELLKENREYIDLVGFCTHLAGAESISNHTRIQRQVKNYFKFLSSLQKEGIEPKIRHMANSAAAFVYPKTRLDMVRIGIMLYGFWSSAEVFVQYLARRVHKTDPLKRILGWKSQIMAIKKVKAGEFVSYGLSYLAQEDVVTALIPVGYSSGYSRSLSNRGKVLVQGQICNVIGLVNMNMIILDITGLDQCSVGDEVVIIGKQGEREIKVSAFSDSTNRLNYEVLTLLSPEIPRKVLFLS